MLKYLVKRLLIFIPTLFAISLLTFIISINAPGDPIDSMLTKSNGGEGQGSQKLAGEAAYNNLRKELGFDLPVFYFSFTNGTYSDTLYKIPKAQHRAMLERLSFTYGNWPDVHSYYSKLKNFENAVVFQTKTPETSNAIRQIREYVTTLYDTHDEAKITMIFSNIDHFFNTLPALTNLKGSYNAIKSAHHKVVHDQTPFNRYIPEFHWYGLNNQYHNWISNFMVGEFGISYQDKRPVASVLWDAVRWTMMISIMSIIIAYLIAIPLGIKSAVKKGSKTEKAITTTLFLMYSLPNFWIATMLIVFFCGGDYFDWFPAFGLGSLPESAPFMDRFMETAYHLILPLFCWTYGSLAFISRQMRGGMLNVIGQDYIRTARAKGLAENDVVWKHAFRNSLIPIITLFASIFPLAISGSFVIEFIFSIPGMGKISIDALVARNYPIVFTVMLFTAILTLIGNLVADMLYAFVDPRISFSKKR